MARPARGTAATLAARRELIDGLAVVNLVVFAIAIMDGVTAFALERPGYAVLATAFAFAFNVALQAAGWLAFRATARVTALTAGLVSGNCNMGLVLVALSGHAGVEVTTFFALAQLPMYMLPALLEPLYRRLATGQPPPGRGKRCGRGKIAAFARHPAMTDLEQPIDTAWEARTTLSPQTRAGAPSATPSRT